MVQLTPTDPPGFGQVDLSNCDREPIHLAGSVQGGGALLLLDSRRVVLQASANSEEVLGRPTDALLGQSLDVLGAELTDAVSRAWAATADGPQSLRVQRDGRWLEGLLHREPEGAWVLELAHSARTAAVDLPDAARRIALEKAIRRYTAAASIGTLADAVVATLRELAGYDRVLLYRFDADGHGSVIAEARDPRLAPLLGHHYPASDIPRQARALYVQNRIRTLEDVTSAPVPLVPALRPDTGKPLDMSGCHWRTMSPVHVQYLRNMGVTASLSASIVRDGRLWGLVAMHHNSPRGVRLALRKAIELLAEVVSTRVAAIENQAHAQVSLLVRRLQQRLIDATTADGDWRLALLRAPQTLLDPVEATGAALFHDGEIITTGEAPTTAELRELLNWVGEQHRERQATAAASRVGPDSPELFDPLFDTVSVERGNPALAPLTPTACGVLAVKLCKTRPEWLMWFRKEQLHTITWAGDPAKPAADATGDPSQVSPRRSFAAWSEIVRGTAVPWSTADRVTARAIGIALGEIIVQVHAVRMLIAEAQLAQLRNAVDSANDAVILAHADGRLIFANSAFHALTNVASLAAGTPVADLFDSDEPVAPRVQRLELQPWRGEWTLRRPGGTAIPVSVCLEKVPGRDGRPLGLIVTVKDLRGARRTLAARRSLEAALEAVGARPAGSAPSDAAGSADGVITAIVSNASLAAMDMAEAAHGSSAAPLLQELESSAQRAAALYEQLRRLEG